MPVKGKHLLHYVPHGINQNDFKPLDANNPIVVKLKKEYFKDKEYSFVVGFNSRNAHRKHPANLILAFKSFCASIGSEAASKCALLLHTDEVCEAGTDLPVTAKAMAPECNIIFDDSRKAPEEMVAFYNICDVVANVSSNEGFGLSIAESLMCGTPIIATVTGGLQDQLGITDDNGNSVEFTLEFSTNCTGRYKNHGKWAKPIWTKVHNVQGSPPTPYILDDLTNYSDIADAIAYWYLAGPEKREECGAEGRRWAINEGGINSKNMCDQFIKAMDYTLEHFTPPSKFDIFTYDGYNTKSLPNDALGFDLHKVDIESIKTTIK